MVNQIHFREMTIWSLNFNTRYSLFTALQSLKAELSLHAPRKNIPRHYHANAGQCDQGDVNKLKNQN